MEVRHRSDNKTVQRQILAPVPSLQIDVFDLGLNESTCIAIGAVHRIANPFDEPAHIIKVQCGGYLGEDDIVRREDNYGRDGTNT